MLSDRNLESRGFKLSWIYEAQEEWSRCEKDKDFCRKYSLSSKQCLEKITS